ncbi:carboxypeptidase regulatory-like domain-containing protein, partial [Verrucomicrobia bacterium]|nr:carboxypeptidase regulatory-like domain-containing protein [Verrucomicrobiota bacterium]
EGDSTGTINWEFDPDDLSRMDYSIQHEGLITISGSWKNQELEYLPEFLSVELPRGTSIGGTVLDEAGDPIEGVDIVFERRRNHGLDNSNSPIRDRVWLIEAGTLIARTGHEGLWQAPCIHPRLSWAAIRLRHPDYADAVYSTDLTKEMESMGLGRSVRFEEMASLKLVQVLEKGIEISGRVVNEEGKPQPGAKVLYADRKADRYRPYLPMRSLPTDAQGRFFLPHQTTRTHYFAVQVMGYAPAIAELDPETGSRTVQLVVSKGRVLTGEVIDHEGLPVPNASISFDDWGVWQGVDWAVTTDDAGLFRWENAPLDRFQVVIKKPGYVTRYRVLGHEPRQELKIYAPLELSGRVVDAATGVPVDQFRLVWSEGHDVFSRRFARIERGGRYSVHVGEINASGWFGGYAHHFQLRVEAEGYQSKLSRLFDSNKGDVGKIDYDFHLESVPRLKIVVTDSENHAVVGAEVTLWTPGSRSFLKGAPSFENQQNDVIRHTDAEGRVDLDPVEAAFGLIAVHQKGIAWVEEWNADETIVLSLQPWGRVEGVVREYDHPVPSVSVGGSLRPFSRGDGASLSMSRGETDKFGRFRFEFLPPGKHRFYRSVKMQNGSQPSSPQFVYIEPGKTTQIEIGGGGRRVVGRFEIENPYVKIDWQRDSDSPSIASKYPERPEPVNPSVTYKAWRELPEVVRAFDSRRQYPVRFLPDGSFWIDDVRDGEYMLDFRIYDPRDPDSFSHGRYVGSISQTLDIVSHEGANSEYVIDVGVISVRLKADIQEGETMAPSFKAVDLNDGEIVLADYKGKWVLLDFWATWCAPCLADLPYFRKVHDRFAGRKDFVMISLSLDSEVTDVTKFLEKNDLTWLHGYLGPMRESSVAREFGVDGIPAVFLVNPNGKIIAKRLRGGKIEQTVSKYLADSSQILTN